MNFVARLSTDHETEEHPLWDDVIAAIRALDAQELTLLTLAPTPPLGVPEGNHHMCIGGGKDDLCIVYLTEDNMRFWNLVDPAKQASTRRIMILIGGQVGDYREAQCVPREWAILAAKAYFETGTRAAGLHWQEA